MLNLTATLAVNLNKFTANRKNKNLPCTKRIVFQIWKFDLFLPLESNPAYLCELQPVRAARVSVDESRKIVKMIVNAPKTLCAIVLAATFQPVDRRFGPDVAIRRVMHQPREARTLRSHVRSKPSILNTLNLIFSAIFI
jgi:hypothetical protein